MKVTRKLSAIAAAATTVVMLAAAAPANAFVYATSALEIDNLLLSVGGAATAVNSYTFNLTNNATLNGGLDSSSAACNSAGAPACSGASPVLDATAVNAPGSTVVRANNAFNFFLTDQVNTYSNADNVINSAQLIQGVPTSTRQIAESLLNINGNAAANSLIQSNTSLSFSLVVAPGATLALSFSADPDQRSEINSLIAGTFLAGSDINASFTINQNIAGGGSVSWTPNGTAANDCTSTIAGVVCTETADTQDLNFNTSVSTNPGISDNSFDPLAQLLTAFGINVTGLPGGTYTVIFNAQTSTSIIRSVPEPGTLGAVGAALALLGLASRRRKSNS
jgi:hypothetical protein